MIPIITYTNSKCADAWPLYFDLLKKYYKTSQHYVISDFIPDIPEITDSYTYNNSDSFYKSWIDWLPTLSCDQFIYMQEDFFLYKQTNLKLLEYYSEILKENPDVSFIRLIKSGISSNISVENVSTLFNIDLSTDYAFSMQPTIWKTSDFIKLQSTRIQITPWDEGKLDGSILSSLNINGLYHYNNEPKRGMNHYDSDIFPYIATALVKGKWNTKEYPELTPILNKYGILISNRGEYR